MSITVKRILSLLIGILLFACGVLFILHPIDTIHIVVNLIGILLIAVGVLRLIRYIGSSFFRRASFLIGSIVDIVFGIIIMYNHNTSVVAFLVLISFWVIMNGITELAVSFDLKRAKYPRWWLSLIAGILGIISGVILFMNPIFSTVYVSVIIAFYFFIFGITFISTFFTLKDHHKEGDIF